MRNPAIERSRSLKSPYYLLGAVALFMNSALLVAQDAEEEIEEVVVTGSYIRNSQFTNASPVISISQDDIEQTGSANLGEYLRTMPYMENIDTVANILDGQDGQQDSNSARFNIRGLGTESTLTLMDGRRAVNESAVSALLPSIAQARVEIVLDGGAALYGSDAVAGVANIIPIKEYEGFRGRTYYKRDQGGDTEQLRAEFLTGKNFDFGVNWVGAFEYSKRTPLVASERPKYLEYYHQASTYGNPGRFWNRFFQTVTDPSCGTFNDGNTDIAGKGNNPSGELLPGGVCALYFGEWQDYGRGAESYTAFNNFTYEPTDWLKLEFQMSHNYRDSSLTSSPSSAVFTNTADLYIPKAHPAYPAQFTSSQPVRPRSWRPFGKLGTLPSHLAGSGSSQTDYTYYADAYKFGGQFDVVGTSWVGEAWLGYQQSRRSYHGYGMPLSRMVDALNGQGGPNGNEWFNPFGSADQRSPYYVEGVTNNSQELVDYLFVPQDYEDQRDRLKYFDVVFNGEVMDSPFTDGKILAAVGGQVRSQKDFAYANPLEYARDDLYRTTTSDLALIVDRESGVRALFVEVEIPLMDNMGVKANARHEDFYNIGFSSTKPKISWLWEPIDSLSLRASYGESFLAPTARQLRPLFKDVCTEVQFGTDPLTGLSLGGAESCSSGNPDVQAEEAKIVNVGFTWIPLDGLSVSVDYQEIEYTDRIASLISSEIATREVNVYLAANNLTGGQFDVTVPADAAAALAWALANPNPLITRQNNGLITDIYRAPINATSQFVDVIDFRVNYSFDVNDWGRFGVGLNGNYYARWDYSLDEFSDEIAARGVQNATTGLAAPLSKYKTNLNFTWYRGDHSARLAFRYVDKMKFDEDDLTLNYAQFAPEYIRAATTADFNYGYSFDAYGADTRLTFGINNLFDRDAQRLPIRNGFESRSGDPYGRQFYMSVDFEL